MGVFITLDTDKLICEECEEYISIKDNDNCSFYSWINKDFNIDGFDVKKDNIEIIFFLKYNNSRIIVKNELIAPGKLNYNILTHKKHIFKQNSLQISYNAFKYDDDNDERLAQINITSISLSNFNLTDFIKNYQTDQHKITCMINDIYLFRPQNCNTNNDLNTREYRWVSYFNNNVENNQNEYDIDMELIKIKDNIYVEKKNIQLIPFTIDNDLYCNSNCQLPIKIKKNDFVYVRLFNFCFTPPKSIETIIQYKEFTVNQPLTEPLGILGMIRKKLRNTKKSVIGTIIRKLLENLNLFIMFIQEEEETISLISVYLKADNYKKTLQFIFYLLFFQFHHQ